jgi:hypothetical protein
MQDQGTVWKRAIDTGIITHHAAYAGLTDRDVEQLHEAGFGELLLLVRLRGPHFDDRRTMTVAQLRNSPKEFQEIIRDVLLPAGQLQAQNT